jgi:phenylalanyl-tRNA synthetase alpha chain
MNDIISKLHPLERKIIPFLKEGITYSELLSVSNLKDIEIMRALQWLSNKDLITLDTQKNEVIELDINGLKYAKQGLPERRFLSALKSNEPVEASVIQQQADLNSQEFGVSMGVLKNKAAITTTNINKNLLIQITTNGKKLIDKPSFEEKFLNKDFPIILSTLKDEEKFAYDNLIKRKSMLKVESKKIITIRLTSSIKDLIERKDELKDELLDNLSHNLLVSGKWKDKKFRHYDININVPAITGGKRHFVKQSIDYIKKVWLELGFKEMEGNLVQSAFWDLDCLFVPQDHPARAMQDSFYVGDPANAKLPNQLKNKIKAVHENGSDTGSKGWGGKWSEQEASKNMLRTHTTVLSAQALANLKKEDLPAKFFSVNKVFRNESLTWKHLFELHQVEGIVVDPNATLKHLKGYLREFYNKLGFEKVRMRPAHFPYTEPSLEVDVFHPEKKQWIELGGAGIFRPELVKPLLGIDVPVLAWGQGLERGIMGYYQFKDIRHLYNNDIKEIKDVKVWR